MIGCLRTHARSQPLRFYFESANKLKFYNLEAWKYGYSALGTEDAGEA